MAAGAEPGVRDAATVVLLRDRLTRPAVLMGQRGAGAVFMPMKFVFPGGAVDADDRDVPLAALPDPLCAARLEQDSALPAAALAACAIRELWEETGLILGRAGLWPEAPAGWADFAAHGFVPDAAALQFIFRAVTPPGRTRRFDARFFLADADALASDPDDFGAASDELAHLRWVPLDLARGLDLPFITEIVLAEVQARLHDPAPPESVPFFRNDDEEMAVARLGLRAR